MQKTKIEWTDYTWNPIKGLCPVGCWYCYARKVYKRFSWPQELRLLTTELSTPSKIKKPSKIFVCSTVDLFHPDIKPHWRNELIFAWIEKCSQHTFQILTKMPENIDRPMPDNVWLGMTLDGKETNGEFLIKESALYNAVAKLKFVSYEPLLNTPRLCNVDWVIAGKLTGHGKRHNPPKGWIDLMVYVYSKKPKVPIFMKNNLKDIWGENLIQEFPE